MDAAKHALERARVIVLHEVERNALLGESLTMIGLDKKTTVVAMKVHIDYEDAGQLGLGDRDLQRGRSRSFTPAAPAARRSVPPAGP